MSEEVSKEKREDGNGDVWAAVVILGLGAASLVVWAWLSKWQFSGIDTLSSVGLLVMAAIVGVGLLVEWFQDWRMLRALRRYLAKARAKRKGKPQDRAAE